jgi:hypothetical protein
MRLSSLFAAALIAFAAPPTSMGAAPNEKAAAPSTEPKDVPLELTIINLGRSAYEVHTNGDPPFKYQENIRKAELAGKPLRATPVAMALEIRNTGPTALKIWVGGDATLLTLDLQGNGARSAVANRPRPTGAVPPVVVEIPAGKSYRMPLKSLASGFRNEAAYAYITEGGLYSLSATFRTSVLPAPPNAKMEQKNGFGEIILKSAPLKIRAVKPS